MPIGIRFILSFTLVVFSASAGTLKINLRDPSGAAVPDAALLVLSEVGNTVATLSSSTDGSAIVKELEGKYSVQVQKDGFADADAKVTVAGTGETPLTLELKVAAVETAIEVSGNASTFANSDSNYKALRNATLGESFVAENIVLQRDAATITLLSGTVTFVQPILNRVPIAVFQGQGRFHLEPAMRLEKEHLQLFLDKPNVDEEFESLVLLFSDGTYDELRAALKTPAQNPKADDILKDFHRRMRRRAEIPRSLAESMLHGQEIPNLDAELLAALYNPNGNASFSAFIHGSKHGDLRFFLNPLGALPELLSTEEVALVNLDLMGLQDGIWYLTHLKSEWNSNTASNNEQKAIAKVVHFRIETVLGKNDHLASVANVRFQSLRDGDRVIRFDLLPNLRVSRVSQNGKEMAFIQEHRKKDGSFYVILPEPGKKDQLQEVQIEYAGDHVVHNAGGGSFSVEARTSWYPNLNTFRDRATYDLTFKFPKRYTLVSVGKLISTEKEGDVAISHWVSDVPLAVAGFNYGDYKLKQVNDEQAKYTLEAYSTADLPDYLRSARDMAAMTPSALAQSALVDAQNSIRIFKHWFGELPYGRLAITQQPEANFGQSWPTLVYLPIFSFLDSTQRWMIMGSQTFGFNDFIQEVTPHEVAHQWWGHLLGWSSYHDQWLSEGFADFSASLFLETTEKKRDKYLTFWERHRKLILEKNEFGHAANDAGPLWMGFRLDTPKTGRAYRALVYPKGSYALHMLRYLMQDQTHGDAEFIAMMQDFTSTFQAKNPSTEDFLRTVEKHMKPSMDLDGNQRMGWFFKQWIYGTEVPSYSLLYHLEDESDGKTLLTFKLTQSGVTPSFRMRVALYADLGSPRGPVRIGNPGAIGSTTTNELKIRLPQRPKKIFLNYNHDVLTRDETVKEY